MYTAPFCQHSYVCLRVWPNCSFFESTFFQLFDVDNPVNKDLSKFLFSTEGHIFPVSWRYRRKPWESAESKEDNVNHKKRDNEKVNSSKSCLRIDQKRHFMLPIKDHYLHQVIHSLNSGLN